MTTLAELTVQEEMGMVRDVAESRRWKLIVIDTLHFVLGIPASDDAFFYLAVDCDDYPIKPPAWHWCDCDGLGRDLPKNTPMGTEFLHGSGVICAPWNRLAYKAIDPRGPHAEWVPTDWRSNSYTRGCKTLCAMALRIAVELKSPHYHKKRQGT